MTPEQILAAHMAEVRAIQDADEQFRREVLERLERFPLNPATAAGYQFGWARQAGDSVEKVCRELISMDRYFSKPQCPKCGGKLYDAGVYEIGLVQITERRFPEI